MKFAKENTSNIVTILVELLIGVLLLIKPVVFTKSIIIGVGVLLLLKGAHLIYKYVRANAQMAAKEQNLSKGLILLLAGWFCAFRADWFILTFPALTILYGIGMLVTGLGKVQMTFDMLRLKVQYWWLFAISAAVSILCAIVVISSPFATTAVLWVFTGITLIVEAVLDAFSLVAGKLRNA